MQLLLSGYALSDNLKAELIVNVYFAFSKLSNKKTPYRLGLGVRGVRE